MNQLVTWASAHPAEIGAAFAFCSALVNVCLRFRTPEEWIAFGEKRPYSAAVIRVIRALGLDPIKAVLAIQTALNARAEKAKAK